MLTSQQHILIRALDSFAEDLDRGTEAEQHTAALLHVMADAVKHGYEAGLVKLVAAWRREVEGGGS